MIFPWHIPSVVTHHDGLSVLHINLCNIASYTLCMYTYVHILPLCKSAQDTVDTLDNLLNETNDIVFQETLTQVNMYIYMHICVYVCVYVCVCAYVCVSFLPVFLALICHHIYT